MAAGDQFKDKTRFVNQMWQTDFTYFKIIGWGWYYFSTIMDDYSRYIVQWEVCSNMKHTDAQRSVAESMRKAGLTKANPPDCFPIMVPAIFWVN